MTIQMSRKETTMNINKLLLLSLSLTTASVFAASDDPRNYTGDDFDIDAAQEHTHPLFGGELPASPSIIQHVMTPHNAAQRTYPCAACNKTFTTINEVVDHEEMCHYQETPCDLCGKPETADHLCDPNDLALQIPPFPSSNSDLPITHNLLPTNSSNNLPIQQAAVITEPINNNIAQAAVTNIPDKKDYACICGKKFSRFFHVKRHAQQQGSGHGPAPTNKRPEPVLNQSEKRAAQAQAFLHKLQVPTGNDEPTDNTTCIVCNKPCLTKINLERHMRMHTGERPYECKACNQTFADGGHFRRHERTQKHCDTLGIPKPPIQPKPAKKNLTSNNNQAVENSHTADHNDNYSQKDIVEDHPQFAEEFNLDALEEEALIQNLEQALGLLNQQPTPQQQSSIEHILKSFCIKENSHYICTLCPEEKRYKSKNRRDFVNHVCTHTGQKTKHCEYPNCTYSCISQGDLIKHKRIHTGEKPFKCTWENADKTICDHAYATSNQLTGHVRTHTGEKTFKCRQGCDYTCNISSNRTRHEKLHCPNRLTLNQTADQHGSSNNHNQDNQDQEEDDYEDQ